MSLRQQPLTLDYSAGFLKAARSGNLDQLLEYLKLNIDVNICNANGLTALHLAAKEGHDHVVSELVRRRANIESATRKGNTPLHIAALGGHEAVVRILVENGANVNAKSQDGFTPLYMAAQENHVEIVKFLLDHSADHTTVTQDGYTPLAVALQLGHDEVVGVLMDQDTVMQTKTKLPALHRAAKKDDVQTALTLIQKDRIANAKTGGGGIVNEITKSGFTPLHIASHYGNSRVGILLIENGADINFKARNLVTPLHVASKWGRTSMVQVLLDSGADINCLTKDGLTALHCAARSGHDNVARLLMQRGAGVMAKTKSRLSPLHMSAQGDHFDCAQLFLRHQAPIDDVTVDYLTPLHVTAHCGSVKTCKLLLDNRCEINARALNGFTPLHVACKKNRIKIIELLLRYGVAIEATTETGLTPLQVAAFMGHMGIVKLLLDNGANPNCANERGETALHLAARGDQTEAMEMLLDNGALVDAKAKELQTALHIAARQGNLAAVDLLLKRGASPNAATKELYTPLHIAVREGHVEIAKRLLDHDANPGLTTKKGFTPLHLAAKHGQMKMIQLLLQRGVDPDIKGRNDLTPLHVGTHYGNPQITTYLMNKGASPVSTTKNGYTPLHIAAKKDHTDIASTLLERGAKPGCESRNGFTPLHLAAKEGHVQMVKLLFGRGADANCRSKNGLTPMHLAAQEDHVPVAELLVKNKAQIDPQTKAGYTPLHTACHFGQINMIQFLLEQGAAVNSTTKQGFTPLHQAAQQGHVMVINLLLRYRANPNAVNAAGQTPLSIAQRLGYLSVIETLSQITTVTVAPSAMTGRYKPVSPETMQEVTLFEMEETRVLRSRRPGAAGVSQGSRRSYQDGDEETFRNGTAIGSDTLPPGAFRYLSPEDAQARSASPSYRDESDIFGFDKTPDDRWGSMSFDYHALEDEMKYMSEPLPSAMDELTGQYAGTMPMAVAQQSKSRAPPPEQLEGHATQFARLDSKILTLTRKRPAEDDVPDSREKQPDFLVSFLVDARGGVMEGSRPAGVRLIIPPGSVSKPTRITCRLIRVEKLSSPPLQMEGEALATRILEMGPPGTKFNRPILIDVPHFASLRGREREILVLRCDDGQTWQEHVVPPGVDESDLLAVVKATFEDVESSDELYKKRISRILESDLPQYFALVTRITKETDNIDTHGGAILSANSPKVKVVVPSGAVPRSTKMGLQVQPIPEDIVTKRLSGRETALSPIVTVNPRRRKFNKPLTVMMPLPKKGFTRHAYNNASTLRLLRNSNDGSVPAQWEDVTDSTPLTIMDDTATFSTPTSASFWLVDTPKAGDAARIASELHPEIILVPFMAKFVVCGRRHLPTEARLRVFCMTGDVLERTIRNQGKFAELARSREVEVLNKTPQYLELDGNLAIVDKSGRQPSVFFRALKANGVPIIIRMCEEKQDPTGRLSFMRDPKYTKSRPLQIPICTMNVTLPHDVIADVPGDLEDEEFENRRLGDPDGSQGYSDSSSVGSSIPMSDQELSPEEKAALHKKFDENASDLESEPDYSMGDQNGRIKKQEPSIPEIVLPTSPVKIDFIQEDNAYSSFAKPTNYGPRILTKPEVKEPAVFVSTVPVHAAAKKEPVITHETVDGGTRLVKDAKDKEYKKPDGSTVKERVSTTKHVKTVTEVTLTDGVPTDSQTKEELLLTEIEENIVELPPGVASLMNTNIQTETTEQKTESTLPDGSPVKKKTVRTVGRLKPSVTPRESKPEAKVTGPKVTHETVDGELIPRSKTEESQKTRDDGVTEKLKIVTTQYFKPVTEITFTDGLETDRKSREVLDNTYIEESILELPSGVIAPNADNCDTDISINTSEFAMPDGTPAKKRTVRMIVHLKTVPEKQISVQRTEGDIRSTSEVLEDQENLDSGRKTRKRKLVTTKHFKPITEITFVDGVASDPVMHEEFFGAEVDENILELSAGVIEPYGANCDTTISLENSELPMEEGVVAKKALVTMAVTPKPEKPDTGTSIVEGPITSRTETRQSEGKLSNGGTVRRKIVTTTFLNPIREVTTGDGPPKSRLIREEVVGMDVVENVLELPPGVTEPNGKNITTKTVLTKSEETLPNGKVAKKKVIKTTAEISDENVGPNDQKPVPAKRKGKTTPTKPSDDITGDDVTRRTVEGEVEPKVDVVEDEERLEEGVIRKRKIVTTRYIKPTFEITIANGMPPEFQKTEEIVDAEIKENILELDYGVVAPNAANCDADILLTHTKTLLPEGVPAKKKTTKITVKLPEDGKQEADAQAKAREARPKESRKLIEGDIERRSTVAEDKQGLSDGGTIKRKIITTKHIKPITEIISKEGKPSKENHWEELVATDIEENILQLPAGIIEPNSSNCDIEVSVDKTQVTLPDGNLANKTSTRMVVTLRDPSKPPKEKRRKRKHGSKGRPDFESEDRDLIEGPVESRTEVKEFEVNRTEGNLIYRVVTTTNVRSILKVSKAGGMEIKTKLREELVSKEIVENVLELPPGVTDINRRDVKTDTTVSSSVEFLPEGVPVKKTVVRTLATLLGKEELAQIPPDSGRVPDVIHKVIEGEIEPRTETEEDEQNLSDGTTIAQKVITTRYVKPITEVKLVKGHPPESTTKEEVVKADVSENILELPCGVIEPYGNNCETDISVAESEVTLPENTPAKKKTTKMIVALLTPSGERIPRITKRLIEGDVESKSSVTEDKEDLNDGGTIWRKVTTTKHIKPITEVTCTDGIPTQTKRWEELVSTDIEENILQLPAGVIEPKASNCDIDVSVDKTQVTLPDGSPASKTVITTVVSLRDPKKPPRGKLRKRKWRPGRKTASKDKPELEDDVIEGPIESRSEVKDYEIKSSSGGLLKYHVVTTTYVKSILKVSKVGGVEKKTKLREELDSRDIVENILELPPGVTDINRRDIKTDTTVTSSSETSPEGVPVTKKVVKTTATLFGKSEIPEITGEADEIPDVVYKSIEGDIEPRIEYEEDEQTLDDGTTVRQNKTTTRYIKPITEVKLVKGSPPESTTKEVVVNAEVAENILELPCGVIEPYGDNCETKVSVTESEVILPDNVPAKAKTTRMVVTLKPPSGEKVPKVTKRLIEGDVESKSSVTEDKEDLNDGGTIWRKVTTTKHIKPITEVTCTDGIPTQTKRWEELVSTDIEENILQLPAGVIEPKASNCDIDVSVDKAEVTLPDGSPAKKTIIKTVVTLRDPKKPPRDKLQKRKWKPGKKIASKDKPELEDDVIEGPIESRSEVKDYEIKSSSGGLLKYHVVTTTYVKSILKVSKVGGVERKTKLREELDSRDIVENILELPPGITDINRRDIKTDTAVTSSSETSPEGVPVTKKVVKTTATLLGKNEIPEITGTANEIPDVVYKSIEGEVEPKIEYEEDEKTLDDGTTVRQNKTTTRYIKPITEVKLVKGSPPESTTKEVVVNAEVAENILELPCGVIEPYGDNCETKVSVTESEVILPDNVPAKARTTRMVVTLKPPSGAKSPSGEKVPKFTKRLIEGDIESKSSVTEDKEDLNDGGTIWRKVTTTKHVKPVTEITNTDGIPTQTKRWEELVGTDIEENVLQLPVGVIEPNSSNCDINVTADKSQVTLPDGSLANKTLIKTVVNLREPFEPPREKGKKRKYKPSKKSSQEGDVGRVADDQQDIIEGPVESRTEVKEYEVKAKDGGLVKYRVVTTSNVKTILKVSKAGGIERKTKLREELDSREIVENILELPPGVTDVNRRDVKTDTTVSSSEETLPEGVPVTKKVVKTTATLLRKGELPPEISKEMGEIPEVVNKVVEGDIEPRIEIEEDEQNLPDGSTVRQTVITTKYVKPITEVKLVSGLPPESTTKEEVLKADVSENILELPCGVIEPHGENCETDVSTEDSKVTLPDNIPADKKTTRTTVALKPSRDGEGKIPKITKKLQEGDLISRIVMAEEKENRDDGSTVLRKTVTVKHFKPFTDTVSKDGVPVSTTRWEELVGTDIEENVLQLPAGVIEPNSSNCDIDVSVDKFEVTLPDGGLANKTLITTVITLRDPSLPPRAKRPKRKRKSRGKSVAKGKDLPEVTDPDIIEGPLESRTEVKEYELKANDGGLLKYRVVTTTFVRTILKLSKVGGLERKTKLREELDSKEIVENVLELPPGVTDVNSRGVKTETTVTSSEETLPEGVPIVKKVIKTVASLLTGQKLTGIPEELGKVPAKVTHKVIEGEIESRIEVEEDEQNLNDGTTIKQTVVTTRYVQPITEVKLVSGSPPESTTREEIQSADVSENILELPCGVIDPFASNCDRDITVSEYDVTLPEGTAAKKRTTRMIVQLRPSQAAPKESEHIVPVTFAVRSGEPKLTRRVLEGEVDSRSEADESQRSLEDGSTVTHRVVTTTYFKPITEIVSVDGIPTEEKHSEEHVGTDIDENIVQLPAGVVEPNASNCDIDVSVDKSLVPLPDGILANKTVTRMIVRLRDATKPPRERLRKRKWKPGKKVATGKGKTSRKSETEQGDIIEGPIESRTDVKEYEVNEKDGSLVKYRVVTTTNVKSILKLTKTGGIERRTKLREELDSKDIVENILELPPGVTDVNRNDVKTDTTVSSSSETLPEGVPVTRKIVRTTASLLAEPDVTAYEEPTETPGFIVKVIEGKIEPKREVEEDEKNLGDGRTLRQVVVTTKYVKPVTEVRLTSDGPPESTTREEIVDAEVSENILDLPCGVIEPNESNCNKDISVKKSEVTLPEGVPAKKKTTTVVVQLQPVGSVKADAPPKRTDKPSEVTRKILEGEVQSKSVITEDQEALDDGGTVKRKIITTTRIKPITEILLQDGLPLETKHREEIIGTDIEENVLKLPCGVIEPNAANCVADLSVDSFEVLLKDGTLAKKVLVMMVVKLKDDSLDAVSPVSDAKKLQALADLEASKNILEGPIQSRTESKQYEETSDTGGSVHRNVVTTTYFKPVLEVTVENGIEKRRLLREDVVSIEVVENILELPPGVTELDSRTTESETSVNLTEESLPNGVPVKKRVVKTVATVPKKPLAADPEQPNIVHRVIDGEVKPVSEVVDFQDNLDDGTAIKRKVTTTRQVKPVTEVKLTKGHPPESTTREETVASDVKEHVLELPCGTIEPNAENCDIDISVDNVEDITPENVPCTKNTTKMTVKLKPPVAETFPQTSRRIVEGEVEARSTVQEFKENLDNGAMAKHKIITTKYIKPITEIVSSDGLTVETKDREELVKTEIEENILQLPAGVIEPNASNCEADISVNTSDVALPDGSLARKTVTKVVIQLKDELLLGEEEAPQLMAGRLLPTKRGEETRTVDGEITTKTDTKEDVEKTSDGAVIKRNIITMTHSRPTILISNVGGKETRTTLKELVVGVDIVENILTLLPGVTDPNEEGVKTDTSLKKFHETLPGGVPVNKEVIKTIAFLVRKQPEKEKEAELWPQDISEVPDVTQRILEGPVQAKSEVKEDQKNLDDGRTIKQKEITTRYVKPVTEVILVDDCPPESTTKEELVGGDVKQIVLDLQCGRIEPFAANCDTDISVENTSTVLPENLSVPKKVIRMTVHLVEPTQEGRDYTEGTGKQRISHRVVEGKITPKSTTKEDEETSFDGTVIRRKVITTQFFKSITDITLVDDVQTDSQTRDELVETIIDETVLQLSPGVIEPDASNCESDISFENSQVTLPDGTLAKKRLVRIVVQIRKEAESGATRTKVIEGPVELRPKLFKDEKKLGDGSTVRRKVTTTRHIQPIIEVVLVNGIETSSHLREEKLILTEIEENILQLPPGVKDVSGNNVQTKTTVKDFEDASPDGSPIKRKVIKTVATVGDQPRPGATEQVAGPRTAEVIEGSIQTRTTVREDQRNLDDGVIRKEKVVTTVHFRPITEVILSEGSAPDSQVREELIKTMIDECILELPAGVIMPFAENCNTEIKVENFEYGLPGEAGYSTPCSKKVVQMIVTLKKEFQPAAGSREALRTGMKPDLQDNKLVEGQTVKLVEGEVESRTKVAEEQENLPNGVTLKRKLITTTFIKPVTEIVLVNGREIERHSREVTVGVDKEEHILELPSGVVEPYASNCDTDISVTNSQEQLPDGIVANKKVVKITVRLKPDYEKPDKSKAVGKRVAEGPVQPRIRVEEKQETKDDGTRVKSTVTTTEHIKSVTETPVVDGVEMESETREQLVSTEIVADIVELLPSVTEPYDDRTTDSNVTVKRSEEVSPDGLPIKKTTTTTTVAPKTRLSPSRVPTAKEVTHKTVKGELRSQTTVAEDKKDLDDGSSIRRKVLTTVYIMPITELTLVNGKETEASTRDEIVSAEIEEHVLQLPAGLIEPHADNCDIDISFKHFDESLPDGTPAKRKVVSTIVRLKVDASRRLESQRAIEGEVRTVRDVKEDERVTGDGRTIRTRTITTKWLKPVTDVALVNGVEVKSKTREVVVATEIEENIIELPPNVKDERRSDLQSRTSVEQDEVVLPDGTVAKRKTTRTVFTEPAEQIPLVKHTLLEGPVESRKTETQDQQNTDDGKTIRRKVITTKHVKPVTDITLVNGTPTESSTKDVLLGVDIEEHILQLPPGVIEPFGSNCDTEISVDNSEEALEEGVVAKKKIVTMVVSLKPQDREIEVFSPVRPTRLSDTQLSPDDRLRPFGDREHSVGRTYERPVEVRKKVTEDQQNLEDGGTLRRKVITTDYVKPIWKVRVIDGKEKESFVRDEVIDTKIEEHILQLPPGVIEPFGSNCETDISVESTEVTLADGRVAKKKIVKMIVFLKGSEQEKVAEKRVSVTEEKPASAEKDFTGIPHISHRLEEGPIASLVKVTESQQILEDGSTVRRKVITTKFVRTVTDITLIDGVETSSETREENIRTEIEEITLKLPAGVIEPYGSNLETDTTVDQFDDTLPDGTPAKKKLVTIVVRLKDSVLPEKKDGASEDRLKQSDKSVSATTPRPSLSDAESQVGSSSYQEDLEAKRRAKAAESAGVVHKVIEGAVSTTTEVKEDETCLEDGTTIRTKIVTTRHYKPVTKLVITDGLVSDATMAEETVKTEIDENILELPPGVTDPKGDDLQTDTTVRTFQETLFDGSMASRKVTKRVITVKPGFRRSHRDAGHSETEQDIVVSQASTTFRKPTQQSRTGADSPDSRTSRDASMDSKSMEMTSVYHRVVAPPQQTHTDRTKVHGSDDSDPNRQKRRSQKSSKDTRLLTVSKPTVTKRVTTKIRRVGPDGEIFEDMFTDEEDLSEVTSPTSAIADFHDLASPTLVSPADSDVDNPAIRVYTDTVETEPVIDRQVQEFEDTLPDGTVVKRRLIRTTQKKTIIKRVVMEGPEDDLAGTSEEQVRQMLPLRPSSTEPQLTKYTDVTKQEPETSTDFKEYDEIMPDGTVVKKRVKTTTQQKLTTERMVLGGKLDDNALREIFKDDGHAKALPAAEGDAKPDQSKASKRSQAEERSSRLMLRKQVHKRTVVEPGREETVITDETLVDRSDEEPEELRDSIRDVIRELVGSSSGSSGDESM